MVFLFVAFSFYFLSRRVLDSFFIAALGVFIYYFPVFFGGLRYMNDSADLLGYNIEPNINLQVSVLFVFFILIVGSLFKRNKKVIHVYFINDKAVFFVLVLSCFALSILILPLASGALSKVEAISAIGLYSIFLEYVFSLGFLFAGINLMNSKTKKMRFFTLFFMVFIVYVSVFIFQTRSIVFFSFLSLVIYYTYNIKVGFSDFKFKYAFVFALVLFLLVGKHLANYFIYGISYNNFYLVFLDSMESIGISSNLNYVYMSGVDFFYLHNVFMNLIPFYKTENYYDYHDVIKDHVFPYASYGMGRNPIGEMWINLQYIGVFIYALALVLKCYFFNFLINSSKGSLKAFVILLMFFSVFYVNRNAMHNDISYLRNYVFFMVIIVFISSFFNKFVLFYKCKV